MLRRLQEEETLPIDLTLKIRLLFFFFFFVLGLINYCVITSKSLNCCLLTLHPSEQDINLCLYLLSYNIKMMMITCIKYYCVPGIVLSTWSKLSHLVPATNYEQGTTITDGESETPQGQTTLRLYSHEMVMPRLEPRHLALLLQRRYFRCALQGQRTMQIQDVTAIIILPERCIDRNELWGLGWAISKNWGISSLFLGGGFQILNLCHLSLPHRILGKA